MIELGIDENTAFVITKIFDDREIFIKDYLNELHGPRVVYNGLSRGSIISLILFNIYTSIACSEII